MLREQQINRLRHSLRALTVVLHLSGSAHSTDIRDGAPHGAFLASVGVFSPDSAPWVLRPVKQLYVYPRQGAVCRRRECSNTNNFTTTVMSRQHVHPFRPSIFDALEADSVDASSPDSDDPDERPLLTGYESQMNTESVKSQHRTAKSNDYSNSRGKTPLRRRLPRARAGSGQNTHRADGIFLAPTRQPRTRERR